jgi:thiol-disulfide isomerase/thioredoxin
MSSLLFLNSDDFNLIQAEQGNILYHDIKGFCLVLFYSNTCGFCSKAIPIFKRLPSIVNGCQFAMINVLMNRGLVNMSQNSITPIRYVPLIILYINGRPYMRYDGNVGDENEIRSFILEISNRIQESGFTNFAKEKSIPAYSIGNPLIGEDTVCYLEFDDAYATGTTNNQQQYMNRR